MTSDSSDEADVRRGLFHRAEKRGRMVGFLLRPPNGDALVDCPKLSLQQVRM